MSYKYKYIHFFLTDNTTFGKMLIDMICENTVFFHANDHLFVTYRKNLYEHFKDKCNIIYCKKPKYFGIDMINKYGDYGKWLFVHSLPWIHQEKHIKKNLRSKILWRTWGHDAVPPISKVELKGKDINIVKKIRMLIRLLIETNEKEWKSIVNQFYAVGTANIIDDIQIKKIFGNVKLYRMPYIDKNENSTLIKNNIKTNDDVLHVMVGHSGYNDDHCKLLRLLKKFENEKIELHFPLNYGNKKYIDNTINYISCNWKGKVDFLTNLLNYDEYTKYVSKMDIIILGAEESYALGNLNIALFYGKTLFVNRNGAIYFGLQKENIPCHFIDEIEKMNFNEFSSLFDYKLNKESSLYPITYNESVDIWKKIYLDLDQQT